MSAIWNSTLGLLNTHSGLSETDINRMVSDAEEHAVEDQKFRELVDVRNMADAQIHAAQSKLMTRM